MWKFNKFTHITFSTVLFRLKADQERVLAVNHKLRCLAEEDSRLSVVDFSEDVNAKKCFYRDQDHLSEEGIKAFRKCFSRYLAKAASNFNL